MKLLHCNRCKDVFNLSTLLEKKCTCGETTGKLIDDNHAVYSGDAVAFGISNSTFHAAVKTQKNRDMNGHSAFLGATFEAYMYPAGTPTIKKELTDLTKINK